MGEPVIHQWVSVTRLRPHHLKAFNAAKYYDDIWPYYHPRGRCPTCWMFDTNCRLLDYREGAQPARLCLHGHRQEVKRPPMLYTGTFHKFYSWADCGELGQQFCYGPCRAKPTQGQISLGNLALSRAAITGRHHDRILVDSATSNVTTSAAETYAPFGTGYPGARKTAYYGWFDPSGAPPPEHRDLVLRFPIDLPANAILLRVRLACHRVATQTNSVWVRAVLLDRDDMGEFVTGVGTEADNPRRDNANGPARLNIQGGDLNRFEIDLNNGGGGLKTWYELPDDIIRPIVQAFIQRPGYVAGQYMGIALASDVLNISTDMVGTAYCFEGGFVDEPQLLVSWREAGSTGRPKASRPPYLQAYQRFTQTNNPVPAEGNWPEYHLGIEAGGNIMPGSADKMPDQPYASAYKHFMLLPVMPLAAWWNQLEYGDAPYPTDAHQKFALNDVETYEVPCFTRTRPWRWRTLGDSLFPKIKAGLRGIVAYSAEPAQNGYLPVYPSSGGDCVVGGNHYTSVDENTWRIHRGQSRATKHVWEADPSHRGWWVKYTAFVRAWFAMDANWEQICQAQGVIGGGSPGDPQVCMFRWNCWYEVEIRARFHPKADLEDPAFKAWVLTHEAGFGSTVTPRYSHCNDVLQQCGAGLDKAMGDAIWPPEACQDVAEYLLDPCTSAGGSEWVEHHYAPCKHEEDAYSWWYLPEVSSKFYKSPIGQFYGAFPEYGLPHETTTIRKVNAAGTLTDTRYNWAQLAFTTNLPWLLDASGEIEVVNTIHRLTITNDDMCEGAAASGYFKVGWDEATEFWSDTIWWNDLAAAVQTAIELARNIGAGNVSVTGGAGGPWELEYIGDLMGQVVPLPDLVECTIEDVNGCAYTVIIEAVQWGTGG